MKSIFLALAVLFILTLGVVESLACSCFPPPTVLDEFTKSDIVMIARYEKPEETSRRIEGAHIYRTYNARLIVEKVYKGNLSPGDEFSVPSGGGGDCTYNFLREKAGQQFVMFTSYAGIQGKSASTLPKPLVLSYSICSRSQRKDGAKPDLAYLENLKTRQGQTRLSSVIRVTGEPPNVANVEVVISGRGLKRTMRTDENGFFEMWGLAPGKYELDYKVPTGYRIAAVRKAPWIDPRSWQGTETLENPVKVEIGSKKHTEVNVFLTIDK